ncbi:hypothetical protein [Streptomyces sp. NBC_00140]|uniref:hypothetical protein n=1 Tax=Streptomyces sp. NBC_00140 TaxID=2975664 RepID=UPI002253BD9B|nr:hypothetical protein [Streptomyces sp. NBC_00140]MCX5333806.1 hypothetical protein [Streptomyces sp. NBC_00140]
MRAATAARTKGTYLNAHYRRLIRRTGKQRALVAVMHKIVIVTWHMLTNGVDYQDLGPSHWQQHPHQVKRRLSALGADTSGLAPA